MEVDQGAHPPTDEALQGMSPPERMQAIGNFLYPLVACMPEVVDASKLTGMLLEGLPEPQLLELLGSPVARAECIAKAAASLKEHAVAQLRERLAFCENDQDIPGIPWNAEPDGLVTSDIPVEREMPVSVMLRGPLELPYVVHIWIQPSGASPTLAGTLSPEGSRFDVVLAEGSVRLHASLALPNALPGLTIAVADAPELDPAAAAAPRTPVAPLTVSRIDSSWADEDEDEDSPLPSVSDLRFKLEARRLQRQESQEAEAAPLNERLHEFHSEFFDFAHWCKQPAEEAAPFILEQLHEQRAMIVQAAVDSLGVPIALYLLHCTAKIQAEGGMRVEPEGKARTSGGVFLKLLKESTELPEGAAREAWERIKLDDTKRAKSHSKKRNEMKQQKKAGASPSARSPLSPWSPKSAEASHRKETVLTSPLAMGETGLSLLLESES